MTGPYPVSVAPEVLRACCDAYEEALTATVSGDDAEVDPDDLTTHPEVIALLAALPRAVRDVLLQLMNVAFPDGDDVDGLHYAHERLLESVMGRLTELDRWVVARERDEGPT